MLTSKMCLGKKQRITHVCQKIIFQFNGLFFFIILKIYSSLLSKLNTIIQYTTLLHYNTMADEKVAITKPTVLKQSREFKIPSRKFKIPLNKASSKQLQKYHT